MLVGLGDIGKDGLMPMTPDAVPIYEGPDINSFTGGRARGLDAWIAAQKKKGISTPMLVAGAAGLGLVLYLASKKL